MEVPSNDSFGPHPLSQALLRLAPKGTVVAQYRADLFAREQLRAEQLVAAVGESVTVEELFDRISESPEVGEMFRVAVDSALRSTSAAHIHLLGKVLASAAAADDEARVDEAGQLMRIAADLDPIDLRALAAFRDKRDRRTSWSPELCLRDDLGLSRAMTAPILARLIRHGLLESERNVYVSHADEKDRENDMIEVEETWSLSSTADAVLAYLTEKPAR